MERIITTGNDYRANVGSVGLGVSCCLRSRPAGREVRVVLNRLIKRKRELSLSFWLWRQEIKRTILAWFYL
jgi:hypothetical protein